jgi:broad specificity phosphatase PhoE
VRTAFLARHALAGSNRDGLAASTAPGEGLTPEGVEQARRLGELLAEEPLALGVATEHRRTQETLEIALEGRDVPRLVVPELDEIHFGSFDGGLLLDYRAWAGA